MPIYIPIMISKVALYLDLLNASFSLLLQVQVAEEIAIITFHFDLN